MKENNSIILYLNSQKIKEIETTENFVVRDQLGGMYYGFYEGRIQEFRLWDNARRDFQIKKFQHRTNLDKKISKNLKVYKK